MIKVEKFQMKHLKDFDCEEIIGDLEYCMIQNNMDPNKDMVTLFYKEEIICFAGVNHLRIGVCEAWIIRSSNINKCKFSFFKTINKLINFVMDSMGVHRFEIAILDTWEHGHKWAKTLGFKFESVAEAYDFNKNDHAIYVRIK